MDRHRLFEWEHLQNMEEGIRLFNEGKFWECHEALEHYWVQEGETARRYVYWAVIQVATTLLHHRNGHLAGACGQIIRAKKKFLRCESLCQETAILERNLDWKALSSLVSAVPDDPSLQNLDELSRFKFKDPSRWV